MKILNTYNEAYQIGKKCIDHLKKSCMKKYENQNETILPGELYNDMWKINVTALQNTLKYLFNKLHHPFYMLCIINNTPIIYKCDMQETAPTFDKAIRETHIPQLAQNTLITKEQKNIIMGQLKTPVRILQCILKKYHDYKKHTDEIQEYTYVIDNMKLPNGVFILNLTDAVLLKDDGTEPFPMVTGNKQLLQYNYNEHLPILSMSGQYGYCDIPIPNYDDIMIINNNKTDYKNFIIDWEKKKIIKAVFRGGASGCGYTKDTNMRVKLAMMKSKYLDVQLKGNGGNTKTINTKSIRFDPIYGLGMLNTKNIKPATRFLTMAEQSNYKYIIHIDGNVNAYRLLTTMRTGSLILRVESDYKSWVEHLIFPNIHYIPIKRDLSDLENKINWCLENDDKCKMISRKGLEFSINVLNDDFIKTYFQKILWELSPYQDIKKTKNTICKKRKPLLSRTRKIKNS
jgi:hypothetical protein